MARKSKKRGKNKKKGKKYKLKTHKATSKRFRTTGTGKIVRTKGRQGHFRRRKSKRAKNLISKMIVLSEGKDSKTIRRLVPYLRQRKRK